MDEMSRKRELQKVPMRKLMSAVKHDIRKQLKMSASPGKSLKKK